MLVDEYNFTIKKGPRQKNKKNNEIQKYSNSKKGFWEKIKWIGPYNNYDWLSTKHNKSILW